MCLVLSVQVAAFSNASASQDLGVHVANENEAYLGVSVHDARSVGACKHASGEANVTVVVRNKSPHPLNSVIVDITDGAMSSSRELPVGDKIRFSYTNASLPNEMVVEASGGGFSTKVKRVLCS